MAIDSMYMTAFKNYVIRIFGATIGSILVFILLPALQLLLKDNKSESEILTDKVIVMQVEKKEEDKRKVPQKQLRTIQTQAQTLRNQSQKFKFTPDLGVKGDQSIGMAAKEIENQIFDESETDERPVLISMPRPVYPPKANQLGIEGRVEYMMVIDPSGRVVKVDILRTPHKMLNQPVVDAARASRWKPAKVKGVAVMCRGRYSINFSLQ